MLQETQQEHLVDISPLHVWIPQTELNYSLRKLADLQ